MQNGKTNPQKIEDLLLDGRYHTKQELFELLGFVTGEEFKKENSKHLTVVIHTLRKDLKRRGKTVICEKDKGYRLARFIGTE